MAMAKTASGPSVDHCAASQPMTSNGPSPQWCCHQRSTRLNGSPTNHSVTSSTMPATIPLAIRPRPIDADAPREQPHQDD